jgi:hypothetical protein
MPHTRYTPVPETDKEIIEETIYRHNTTRGVTIKHERMCAAQPSQTKSDKSKPKKSSSSRSKGKAQIRHHLVEDVIPESPKSESQEIDDPVDDATGDITDREPEEHCPSLKVQELINDAPEIC